MRKQKSNKRHPPEMTCGPYCVPTRFLGHNAYTALVFIGLANRISSKAKDKFIYFTTI